jgi:hypothetical protein
MMLGIKEWKKAQGSWISFVGSDDMFVQIHFQIL